MIRFYPQLRALVDNLRGGCQVAIPLFFCTFINVCITNIGIKLDLLKGLEVQIGFAYYICICNLVLVLYNVPKSLKGFVYTIRFTYIILFMHLEVMLVLINNKFDPQVTFYLAFY